MCVYVLTPRIMLTSPCDSKIGVYMGIHSFLIFALKHRLWVLVRTASLPAIYVLSVNMEIV